MQLAPVASPFEDARACASELSTTFEQDMEDCQRQGGILEEGLQGLTGAALKQARAASAAAVDALMLSDAPLLFPPGQLALAALRSGCNQVRCLEPLEVLTPCSSCPRTLSLQYAPSMI